MFRIQIIIHIVFLTASLAQGADVKVKTSRADQTTASTNTVDGPVIGYVAQVSPVELRAILGVPGAARFSDPFTLPDGATSAEVAPGQSWALLVRNADVIAFDLAAQTTAAVLSGVPASWCFSPSGGRVALFYPDRGEVVIVGGLPANPKTETRIQATSIDGMTLSDGGNLVYTTQGRVQTGTGQFLYESDAIGPIAFEAGREAVVLYDRANDALLEIALADVTIRTLGSGFGAPDQLIVSRDKVYAGSKTAATVWMISLTDGTVTSASVPVSRMMRPALTDTVVSVFDFAAPTWLMNAQGVSFVPAIAKPAAE